MQRLIYDFKEKEVWWWNVVVSEIVAIPSTVQTVVVIFSIFLKSMISDSFKKLKPEKKSTEQWPEKAPRKRIIYVLLFLSEFKRIINILGLLAANWAEWTAELTTSPRQ